jgi:hypothetical protein
VIAIGILSVSIVTILGQISQAVAMSSKAKTLVTAAQLGRNLINEIQLEGEIKEKKKDGKFEDFEGFHYEYEISKVDIRDVMPPSDDERFSDIKLENLFKIQILVYWENRGKEMHYEAWSYLFSGK